MSRGRGPTKLISPLTTFHSSGSSSRLVVRNHRPKPVSRSSSGSGFARGAVGGGHRPELDEGEGLAVQPGAGLAEQDRRTHPGAHEQRDDETDRHPDRRGEDHQSEIEASLAEAVSPRPGTRRLPGSLVTGGHASTLAMVAAIRSIAAENEKRSA